MKLLSKNPDNRYPSAEALFADLDRFRQGQALAAAAAVHPGGTPSDPTRTAALPVAHGQQQHGQQVQQGRPSRGGTRVIPQAAAYTPPPRRRGGLIFAGMLASLLILAGFLVLISERGNLFGSNDSNDTEPTPVEVATVEVPAVGGRGEADAQSELRALGFEVSSRLLASDNIQAGNVIQTEPAAGTRLAPNSPVTLVVSSGPNASQVPSVLTMSENDALRTISSAGFVGLISRVTSQLAPEGEVIGQTPRAGEFLRRGETVTIEVSAGTEEIPVPDVIGQTLQEARGLLEAEGFTVSPDLETEFDPEIPADSVVDTVPPPGSPLAPGGTITLVISDGPEDTFLPNWVGQDRTLARSEAQERGLIVVEFGRVVSDPTLVNRVIEQLPAPNSFVIPGNQVQLIVGVPDPTAGQPQPAPTTPVNPNAGQPPQPDPTPDPNAGQPPQPDPTPDPNAGQPPQPDPTGDPNLGGQGDAQPGDGFNDG